MDFLRAAGTLLTIRVEREVAKLQPQVEVGIEVFFRLVFSGKVILSYVSCQRDRIWKFIRYRNKTNAQNKTGRRKIILTESFSKYPIVINFT